MRLHGGLVLVIVLALAGAFVLYAAWQNPAPGTARNEPASGSLPPVGADPSLVADIELETPELHVGAIPNSGIFETRFKVYNRGRAPLRLGDVRTTCGCTQGRVPESGRVVAPGGEGAVEVMIDPRRIADFHVRKTLTVFSNDPDEPRVNINVVADIEPEFAVIPEKVAFGTVSKGAVTSQTVLVRQLQQNPLEIAGVMVKGAGAGTGATEDLTVEWRRKPPESWSAPDKAEFEITATVGEQAPPGPYVRFLELKTNIERLPILPIQVTAEVEAPYAFEPAPPQVLAIVVTAAQPGARADVLVTGEAPVEIRDLNVDAAHVVLDAAPGDAPNTAVLTASVSPDAPAGRYEGTVRFAVLTGGKTYQERIGVRVIVAR